MDFGSLCYGNDFVRGAINSTISNIKFNSIIKKGGILGHHSNTLSEGLQCYISDVLAIDKNSTPLDIVKAEEKSQNGGFPVQLSKGRSSSEVAM